MEAVKGAFRAWEKCPAPECFKCVYKTFSIIKGNNHYHIYFGNS